MNSEVAVCESVAADVRVYQGSLVGSYSFGGIRALCFQLCSAGEKDFQEFQDYLKFLATKLENI